MSAFEYAFKPSAFQKPRHYTLSEEGILITQETKQILRIPYENLLKIRLYYKPGRFKTNNYACQIKHTGGVHTIFSVSYDKPGSFLDQRDSYVPFVKELTGIVSLKNPKTSMCSGLSSAKYWSYLTVISLTVLVLLLTFAFIPFGGFSLFLLRFLFLLYLLYYSIKMIKKGKPGTITGVQNIPKSVLPEI